MSQSSRYLSVRIPFFVKNHRYRAHHPCEDLRGYRKAEAKSLELKHFSLDKDTSCCRDGWVL